MINDTSLEFTKKCITSNRKALPGVMTIRGCACAGSRGVCWGPVKDVIHISHGPVGCGMYSTMGRRHYANGTTGVDIFTTLNVTSDFQERDIVFGGDKNLKAIIDELKKLFPLPKGYTIQSECPIGLIGDDIEAVAKVKSEVRQNRQDHRAGAVRRLSRRVAVLGPPHRQRHHSRLGAAGPGRRRQLRDHAL